MSRFVSAGNTELSKDTEDAWRKAQEQIDATKKQREDAALSSGLQEGGKTLFETLQANKAAKQEAFEESLRLKTQVQFLNEEDEEYLQSLSTKERAQRAASTKEAKEQLAAFRKLQEQADKAVVVGSQQEVTGDSNETWAISAKKRKKEKDQELFKGIKLRKTSSTTKAEASATRGSATTAEKVTSTVPLEKAVQLEPQISSQTPKGSGLGLAAYSSDEDD